jgi:hypothetical protein
VATEIGLTLALVPRRHRLIVATKNSPRQAPLIPSPAPPAPPAPRRSGRGRR